jgi:hypothetical protein
MSYRAIAAALALEDLSVGQRLTAFALASYANREHCAWPAARTAAVRAGLSRRQYLVARAKLAERQLISIESIEGRQPGSALLRLGFAESGPSIEREINAGLFGTVLTHSRSRGGARVLLAVLAALSDGCCVVDGLSAEEICDAGGLSDSTYRRARTQLLAGDELTIEAAGGGRARCNRWRVADARASELEPRTERRSIPLPAHQPPLLAVARERDPAVVENDLSVGSTETANRPHMAERGTDRPTFPATNPVVNPVQNRTPSRPETPSQTPPETPSPYVRAGRESQNLRTTPPDPPEGGQPVSVEITESFITERGRRRTRRIEVSLTELSPAAAVDREAWQVVRRRLGEMAGSSTFEIWLAGFELIAVSVRDRALLIAAPGEIHGWAAARYRHLFQALSAGCGRQVRPATERELAVHHAIEQQRAGLPTRAASSSPNDHDQQEAV